MKIEVSLARRWYNNSIPTSEKRFLTFASNSVGMVHSILKNEAGNYSYKVDTGSESAYFDIETSTIAIPSWYLDRNSVLKYGSPWNEVAITLINGSTIHESLHAALTTESMAKMIESVNGELSSFGIHLSEQVIAAVINIIEDLYIERSNQVLGVNKSWLQEKNRLFFKVEEFEKALLDFNNEATLSNAINLILFAKNFDFEKEIRNADARLELTFRKIRPYSTVNRLAIAIEFIKAFYNEDESVQLDEAKFSSDGELVEGSGEESASSQENENNATMMNVKIRNARTKIRNEKSEHEENVKFDGLAMSTLRYYDDILKYGVSEFQSEKIYNIKLSAKFIELLTKSVARKVAPSVNKKYGSKIHPNLANGVISGNYFNKKMENGKNKGIGKDIEIVILLDVSGSTEKPGVFNFIDSHKNVFELKTAEIALAKKLFESFSSIQIPTHIFAHTTYSEHPIIVKIADASHKSTLRKRLEAIGKIQNNSNADGMVVTYINKNKGKFFKTQNSRRVVIVLSDGKPSARHGYKNDTAMQHTIESVRTARKNGIEVYSLSLVDGVVNACNEIYGEDCNFYDSNLNLAINGLILKIAKGDGLCK